MAYMKKQSGPAVKHLDTADALAQFIPKSEKDDSVVVGMQPSFAMRLDCWRILEALK